MNVTLPNIVRDHPPLYSCILHDMFEFGKLLRVCYHVLALKKMTNMQRELETENAFKKQEASDEEKAKDQNK